MLLEAALENREKTWRRYAWKRTETCIMGR